MRTIFLLLILLNSSLFAELNITKKVTNIISELKKPLKEIKDGKKSIEKDSNITKNDDSLKLERLKLERLKRAEERVFLRV